MKLSQRLVKANKVLQRYDKFLYIVNRLDGSKVVFRKSPFSTIKTHNVLNIENEFVGGSKWILDKLILMDTQRFSIIEDSIQANKNIRTKPEDNRLHREVADLLDKGGFEIIT